jgi:hypothetical protein
LGANNVASVLKNLGEGEENKLEFTNVAKYSDKENLLWSVVYAPDTVDHDGDIATKEVIKEMAYSYAKNKGGIDINHDFKTLPTAKACVVESFITTKSDSSREGIKDLKHTDGSPINLDGAWAVAIKLYDESLVKLYTEQQYNGISMAGTAQFDNVKDEEDDKGAVEKLISLLQKIFTQKSGKQAQSDTQSETQSEEIEMTKEEMEAQMKAQTLAISTALGEVVKSILPKKEEDQAKVEKVKVEFEGDTSNPEDIKKHRIKLLEANVDWSDDASIAKFLAAKQKLEVEEPGKSNHQAKKSAQKSVGDDLEALNKSLMEDYKTIEKNQLGGF